MDVEIDPAMIHEIATAPGGWEDVALERKAVAVELLAKRFVHVDTGRLRASITHEIDEDANGRVAFVGSDVDYAIFQELDPGDIFPSESGKYSGFPRIHHTGRAFLRPALQAAVR